MFLKKILFNFISQQNSKQISCQIKKSQNLVIHFLVWKINCSRFLPYGNFEMKYNIRNNEEKILTELSGDLLIMT